MSNTYKVRATKWSGGWELHIDGEGVTQAKTLDQGIGAVESYLETMHDRDFSRASIEIYTDLGGLESDAAAARQATADAAEAQIHAAEYVRKVARELRQRGLSVTDMATILGVSRGRISQLVSR